MERGTWIVLSNSGGELDRKFVPDTEAPHGDLSKIFLRWLADEGTPICGGDTIAFIEGESECT